VAGSGKTVILIARAKLLAEDLEKRILILCNNRLLAQHLAVALAGHRHVTATTFHRWAVRCGIDFREGEEDGAFGERLLARLRGDAGPRGGHDAVLVMKLRTGLAPGSNAPGWRSRSPRPAI
jgi:hypothetical protein